MNLTRRSFVLLSLCTSAQRLFGQNEGIATRDVKAQPKPAPSGRPFNAHFTDVAREAGLHAPIIYGGIESKKYILEANGCGCAFIDYDNDGWMDLFILSGTRLEGNPPEATNRLYKNNRDGTFTDVTEKAGLTAAGWANGVCVGDYNNDGFDDIFCTYFGHNRLYKNNGDGTFTDVTKQAGLLDSGAARWGAGCAFVDYNRDGHLDLFVSNYIRFSFEHAPTPGDRHHRRPGRRVLLLSAWTRRAPGTRRGAHRPEECPAGRRRPGRAVLSALSAPTVQPGPGTGANRRGQ